GTGSRLPLDILDSYCLKAKIILVAKMKKMRPRLATRHATALRSHCRCTAWDCELNWNGYPPTRRATRRRANRTIECGNFDFHGRWCAKPRTIAESTDDPITPVDPTPGPAESGNRPYYSDHAFRVAAGVAS